MRGQHYGGSRESCPRHGDGPRGRAPLLLIAGGEDCIFPAAVTRSSFERYRKSAAVTAYKEFPELSHYTIGEPGWEQVADYALRWAMENAHDQDMTTL